MGHVDTAGAVERRRYAGVRYSRQAFVAASAGAVEMLPDSDEVVEDWVVAFER